MKIITVVGARPNFVKVAPLCSEFAKHESNIKHILLHTGQHFDKEMSGDFFHTLLIPQPDIMLGVGSASQTVQTANIMIGLEKVCLEERPDWLIVVGDVNSTLAASLVAGKMGIKLAHIEAGLRSFDRTMPEELNRKVTDAVADILFTPSTDADENLKGEGIPASRIKLVGNIMIDTLVMNLEKIKSAMPYKKVGLEKKKYVYVTLHRPSNVDNAEKLTEIINVLEGIEPEYPLILPLHPRTTNRLKEFGLEERLRGAKGINILEPVSYIDSLSLAKNAKLAITDSGGLQEETTFLGTPCLTLRDNTERPVTITYGTNKLTTVGKLGADVSAILQTEDVAPKECKVPYWDGKTAERIVAFFTSIE